MDTSSSAVADVIGEIHWVSLHVCPVSTDALLYEQHQSSISVTSCLKAPLVYCFSSVLCNCPCSLTTDGVNQCSLDVKAVTSNLTVWCGHSGNTDVHSRVRKYNLHLDGSCHGHQQSTSSHLFLTSNIMSFRDMCWCPVDNPCSDLWPKKTVTVWSAFLPQIPSEWQNKSHMNVFTCTQLSTSRHVIFLSGCATLYGPVETLGHRNSLSFVYVSMNSHLCQSLACLS